MKRPLHSFDDPRSDAHTTSSAARCAAATAPQPRCGRYIFGPKTPVDVDEPRIYIESRNQELSDPPGEDNRLPVTSDAHPWPERKRKVLGASGDSFLLDGRKGQDTRVCEDLQRPQDPRTQEGLF